MATLETASTRQPDPASPSRLSISNLPIRSKVALVLVAPLLLAGVLTALNVLNSKAVYERSQFHAAQASIVGPATRYQSAIERAAVASRQVTEFSEPLYREAIAVVRSRSEELKAALAGGNFTPEVTELVTHVLTATQKARDGEGFESLDNAMRMANLVAADVSKLTNVIANGLETPEPQLQIVNLASQAHLALSKQQMLMGSTGELPEDVSALFAQLGAENLALTRMDEQTRLRGEYQHAAKLLFLINANDQRVQTATTGIVPSITSRSVAPYEQLIPALLSELNASLGAKAAGALRQALFALLASGLAFLLAITSASLVATRIVGTIRRVHDDTLDVAEVRLPEAIRRIRAGEGPGEFIPVRVTTTEETGQLARAVDSLHEQAVRLAANEAEVRSRISDMFTTLSRRNTSLVNQQLGVLETLEQDEQDPDRLERLFRLDHLAARMRRNAQSLVILAGAPSASVGTESISVNEALMAALGGVSNYERVRIEPTAGQMLDAKATSDVVHLLTELLDNALAYSPPNSSVELTTSSTTAAITVRIKDGGLGLKDEDLQRLRADLRTPREASAETARRMGLFVVSRLAHRHGITVELDPNDWGGITASIMLPQRIWTPAPVLPEDLAMLDLKPAPAAAPAQAPAQLPEPTAAAVPSIPVAPPAPVAAPTVSERIAAIGLQANGVVPATVPVKPLGEPVTTRPHAPAGFATAAATLTDAAMGTPKRLERTSGAPVAIAPHAIVPSPAPDGPAPVVPVQARVAPAPVAPVVADPTPVAPGWSRQAAKPQAPATTASGLPIRQRGTRPVPGGSLGAGLEPIVRDAEALRQRLSAHAAGVARGRQTSAVSSSDTVS